MPQSLTALFLLAQQSLHLVQADFATLLGSSRRTVQRWTATAPPSTVLLKLVPHVLPVDPALAQEMAASLGTTLEALGLVQPPPPPAPDLSPPAPPPPLPASVVKAVVCAAAEAMDLMPREVRTALEIGLSVEDVVRALGETAASGR